jgi:hypothetical protein
MALGFAALTGAQALIIAFWVRLGHGHASAKPIVGFMALGYIGFAYLVSLAAGTPDGAHFWIVFTVAVAILSPIVLLAPRLLFRRPELSD